MPYTKLCIITFALGFISCSTEDKVAFSGNAASADSKEETSEIAATPVVELIPDPAPPIQDIDTPNRPPVITSTPITALNFGDPIGDLSTFDFASWEVIHYANSQNPATFQQAHWAVTGDTVKQTVNADASIFLSQTMTSSQKILGRWNTADNDDDFMGFVFGYQDRNHYYLFDWRAGNQSLNGFAGTTGMSVKVVNSTQDLTGQELWSTASVPDKTTLLFHNDISWQQEVVYGFELNFSQGMINIIISDADGVEIANISVDDSTYQDGKFGFYNFSQGNLTYEGFKHVPIQGTDYRYQVIAKDEDGDSLTYKLVESPEGMTINAQTGLIEWEKGDFIVGEHLIKLEVSDIHGASVIQEFRIKA